MSIDSLAGDDKNLPNGYRFEKFEDGGSCAYLVGLLKWIKEDRIWDTPWSVLGVDAKVAGSPDSCWREVKFPQRFSEQEIEDMVGHRVLYEVRYAKHVEYWDPMHGGYFSLTMLDGPKKSSCIDWNNMGNIKMTK